MQTYAVRQFIIWSFLYHICALPIIYFKENVECHLDRPECCYGCVRAPMRAYANTDFKTTKNRWFLRLSGKCYLTLVTKLLSR